MKQLSWPTLFCNSLEVAPDGTIAGYRLRQKDGKREAVKALKSLNIEVFAAGDSFNDLNMIRAADSGCLFRAPDAIRADCAREPKPIFCVDEYGELLNKIAEFLKS
jgi:phosphoserine/homoserine phosphotransferase